MTNLVDYVSKFKLVFEKTKKTKVELAESDSLREISDLFVKYASDIIDNFCDFDASDIDDVLNQKYVIFNGSVIYIEIDGEKPVGIKSKFINLTSILRK